MAVSGTGGALLQQRAVAAQSNQILQGVWKFSFGTPEKITPVSTRHYPPATSGFDQLPSVAACPVSVTGTGSRRGYLVGIPLAPNEAPYGLGLQLQSFMQRGTKKKLRVNADPKMDTGDSHAPVPCRFRFS
jgi:alpha-D-xyloside xylohydrolase